LIASTASGSGGNVSLEKRMEIDELNANGDSQNIANGSEQVEDVESSLKNVPHNEKEILNFDLNFEKIPSQSGRKKVRCKICFRYPQVVLMHCKQKNHLPPICSELGTVPRSHILANHLESNEHKVYISANNLAQLSASEIDKSAPINKLISKQNNKVAHRIGQFMCTIFNDAKRGTLSAWSWPSREVVELKRQRLDLSKNVPILETYEGDLQYVSPSSYREIMNCIVEADIINLKNKLKKCLAISLRCDGSVDRTQIDNIHVLAKVVTEKGNVELIFIGFEEPKNKGASGHYEFMMLFKLLLGN